MKMEQKSINSSNQANGKMLEQNEKCICINPDCKAEFKYIDIHEIQLHEDCTGWVIKESDISKIIASQNMHTIDSNTQNTFDFKFSPLKSVFQIRSIFHSPSDNQSKSCKNPIQLLKINFQLIKQKLLNELARVFYQISDRIEKINKIQDLTVSEIKKILSQNNPVKISQSIKKSSILKEYKEFSKKIDLFTLIHEEKITKQIFKIFSSIENIGKSFWNTELDSFKRQKQMLEKAKKNIQNFNRDQSLHPNVKLQTLANMFEAKNIQPLLPQNKMSASIKCWLCSKECNGKGINIKQHKASACQNLIYHIMTEHKQQTMQKFICQILKTALHKISFEELIAQIEEKNYSEYVIIDRQNSNKGIEEFINNKISQKTFIVNVLSSQNQKIAAGKYILARSKAKDSADTLMIMIIYAIVASGFYRFTTHYYPDKKPKITLLTKDHFADSLKDILKNDFNLELQIVK